MHWVSWVLAVDHRTAHPLPAGLVSRPSTAGIAGLRRLRPGHRGSVSNFSFSSLACCLHRLTTVWRERRLKNVTMCAFLYGLIRFLSDLRSSCIVALLSWTLSYPRSSCMPLLPSRQLYAFVALTAVVCLLPHGSCIFYPHDSCMPLLPSR